MFDVGVYFRGLFDRNSFCPRVLSGHLLLIKNPPLQMTDKTVTSPAFLHLPEVVRSSSICRRCPVPFRLPELVRRKPQSGTKSSFRGDFARLLVSRTQGILF